MFHSWMADKQEQHEMYHDYGTFVGAFSNPDMAQKIWDSKDPQYSSTDEEFDESSRNVMEIGKQLATASRPKHRRHRRRKVLNK